MTDKMVNGILFIIAGLGSVAVYMGLGETGLLDNFTQLPSWFI